MATPPTGPLGASIDEYPSQPRQDGGLGHGPPARPRSLWPRCLGLVTYLTITKRDQTPPEIALDAAPHGKAHPGGADKRLEVSPQEA
jgi:hypothetical protein